MSDIPLPPDTVAQLSALGATFFLHGIVLVVPRDATSRALFTAAELLDRLGQEAYTAEVSDCGGT